MNSLQGKVAVVTGGSSGIGAASVELLAESGASVAVLDKVDADVRRELSKNLCGQVRFFQADISRGSEFGPIVDEIQATLGTPTLLVNNAGIQHYGSITETPEEEWDRVMAINLKGAFLCSKAFIPGMVRAGRGAIVNVSSVQSFIVQRRVAAYATSKTALLGLTRSIAVDYAPAIRCNTVCPGSVDTPMLRAAIGESAEIAEQCKQMHLLGRIGRAEEIADLICFLLSEKASFITGQAFRIDGGLGLSVAGSPSKAGLSEISDEG